MSEFFFLSVIHQIRKEYFDVRELEPNAITLRSRNTGHSWRLIYRNGLITQLHKHHDQDPFHVHAHWLMLDDALYEIYDHDIYQLNGRRCKRPATALSHPRSKKNVTFKRQSVR